MILFKKYRNKIIIVMISILSSIMLFGCAKTEKEIMEEKREVIRATIDEVVSNQGVPKKFKGKFIKCTAEIYKIVSDNEIILMKDDMSYIDAKFSYDINRFHKLKLGDLITISGRLKDFREGFLSNNWLIEDSRIENSNYLVEQVNKEQRDVMEISYFKFNTLTGRDEFYNNKGKYVKWTMKVIDIIDNNELILGEKGKWKVIGKFSYPIEDYKIKKGDIITVNGKPNYHTYTELFDKKSELKLSRCRIEPTTKEDLSIYKMKDIKNVISENQKLTKIIKERENAIGNSSGNMINLGLVAKQGNNIYRVSSLYLQNRKLVYESLNEGNVIEIGINYAEQINIIRNWIYFKNKLENNIYKCRLDGSSEKLVCIDNPNNLILKGEHLYYINLSSGNKIFSININGLNRKIICNENVKYMNIVDDWIYYINKNDNNIYKIDLKGNGNTKIGNEQVLLMNVVGNWIYYINIDDNNKLYKIKIDGNEKQKLSDDKVNTLNVSDGWIYYTNEDDRCKIYRIKENGTFRSKLNENESYSLNIVDSWIYYKNHDDLDKLYKIKIDGSKINKIE